MRADLREPDRHREGLPKAVVISAGGSPGALDIVRCLELAGIFSCVMSSQQRDIGFFSRGCKHRIRLPKFEQQNYGKIVSLLLEYSAACKEKPVLYYASDPELKFVWMYREELERAYRFLLPPAGVFESLLNKVMFSEYARACRLPVPHAIRFHDAGEVEARVNEIPLPCIVKPAFSDHWNWKTDELWEKFGPYKSALRKFTSYQQLIAFCKDLPQRSDGFIIQKYVEGRDESIYSFHGYFDDSSNCIGSFVGCKIRTYPMHTGGSTYIRTLHHERLTRLSVRLLKKMNYRGIVKIDFKHDRETGEFYVLEVNARYNLWQVVGARAGINLAALAYRHQRGERFTPGGEYRNDFRLLYFKQDIRSFLKGYHAAREWTTAAYIKSLWAQKCYRVWSLRDPLPFLISLAGFALRNILRLGKTIRPVHQDREQRLPPPGDDRGQPPVSSQHSQWVQPSKIES